MNAGPGVAFGPGRTIRHSGEAASISARSWLIFTRFASASPRNSPPQIEKESLTEIMGATLIVCEPLAEPSGFTSAAAALPEAFAITTSPSVGVVKTARPVESVITLWSFATSTVTPETSFPSAPKTASVAGLPATTFGGSTIVTDHVGFGVDCARVVPPHEKLIMTAASKWNMTAGEMAKLTERAARRDPRQSDIILKCRGRSPRTRAPRGTAGKVLDRSHSPERTPPGSRARAPRALRVYRDDRKQ